MPFREIKILLAYLDLLDLDSFLTMKLWMMMKQMQLCLVAHFFIHQCQPVKPIDICKHTCGTGGLSWVHLGLGVEQLLAAVPAPDILQRAISNQRHFRMTCLGPSGNGTCSFQLVGVVLLFAIVVILRWKIAAGVGHSHVGGIPVGSLLLSPVPLLHQPLLLKPGPLIFLFQRPLFLELSLSIVFTMV